MRTCEYRIPYVQQGCEKYSGRREATLGTYLSIQQQYQRFLAELPCVYLQRLPFLQDPKYRSLSTSSKVYQDVLASHPPMLEVLRLAGFRHKDGDETRLTLLHR